MSDDEQTSEPGGGARVRRRDPDEKKRAILAAARQLFCEHGAANVKVSQVAAAAGVSEGIIFHHFGNKRSLLAAVAADYGQGVAQAIFASIVPGQPPDVEQMVRGSFDYVRENGKLHDLMVLTNDPGDWNTAFQSARGIIVAALEEGFRRYLAAGWIETNDPGLAATLIYGMVESALMDCFVREEGERIEEYIRETASCIVGALRYDPHRAPPTRA